MLSFAPRTPWRQGAVPSLCCLLLQPVELLRSFMCSSSAVYASDSGARASSCDEPSAPMYLHVAPQARASSALSTIDDRSERIGTTTPKFRNRYRPHSRCKKSLPLRRQQSRHRWVAAPLILGYPGFPTLTLLILAKGGAFSSPRLLIFLNRTLAPQLSLRPVVGS